MSHLSIGEPTMIDYRGARYLPRAALVQAHADTWSRIGGPGAFLDGVQRVELVAESRRALDCGLCDQRRSALSPFAIDAGHGPRPGLLESAVELAHRLTSDPGRLTRRWFDGVVEAGLSLGGYVEAVSVIAASVVIDTLHRALGLGVPALPAPRPGAPSGHYDRNVIDDGAWLPLRARSSDAQTDTGLPHVPNIARALSFVPDAVALFFGAFAPHYRLAGLDFAISRSEAEYVAARVSMLNQCFY